MKRSQCFFLLASCFMALLAIGCGGPGAPGVPAGVQTTVETDYGVGLQNVGYTMVDPNVKLSIAGADQGCSNGQNVNYFSGKTNANGQASFGVTCSGELIQVVRYPDTGNGGTDNCDITNRTDSHGVAVYLYNPFAAYASPAKLPCGSVTAQFILSPTPMLSNNPASTLTMTGPLGSLPQPTACRGFSSRMQAGVCWARKLLPRHRRTGHLSRSLAHR